MATFKDYGIVLNNYWLYEADKVLNIYTKQNGLIKAISKASKKSSNKFYGKLDQLSCCYFQFAKGKNLYTICEYERINSFPKIRSDLTKLSNSLLILEVVKGFAYEHETDSEYIYEIFYSALNNMQATNLPELVSLKFITAFLSIHGLKPQLKSCVHCSTNVQIVSNSDVSIHYPYSSLLGGILCKNCSLLIDHRLVSLEILNTINNASTASTVPDLARESLELFREYLNLRAKHEIKSFDLVFSL